MEVLFDNERAGIENNRSIPRGLQRTAVANGLPPGFPAGTDHVEPKKFGSSTDGIYYRTL